jgi:hypothetical protein
VDVDAGAPRPPHRWLTPTGEPCPRVVRVDGTLEGSGDCVGCGFCHLLSGLVDPVPTATT